MTASKPLHHFKLGQIFPAPWPTIWLGIFAANIVLGIIIPSSPILTTIRLSGILLCVIYAWCYFRHDHLLIIAMLATFIADCILAINNLAEIGLIFFLIAQLCHLYRLDYARIRRPIIVLITLIIFTIVLDLFLKFTPLIHLTCAFYLFVLATNIDISWRWYRQAPRNPRSLCALAGFTLFLCCDICTGVSYLSLQNIFSAATYAPANFFAWFFYYPSQILVSNSSKCATIYHKGR